MADEEIKEEQQPEASGEKSPIVKILLIVIIAVILIGITAIVAYFVGIKVKEPSFEGPRDQADLSVKVDPHITFPLGEIKAVLQGNHNFKAVISLAYESKYQKAAFSNELTNRRSQILNLINRILMRKTKDDLTGVNIERFAEELKININRLLINGQLVDVYFEEYVVQ